MTAQACSVIMVIMVLPVACTPRWQKLDSIIVAPPQLRTGLAVLCAMWIWTGGRPLTILCELVVTRCVVCHVDMDGWEATDDPL